MNGPLVIYHAHCADGWAAAWAAYRRSASWATSTAEPELLPASYGDDPPEVDGRDVLIVDFSYPRETMLEMHGRARSLLVFDHHKSAAEALAGLPFAVFDMERSGAGLVWDELTGHEPRPWIVDYVEDRDLWRWALPDSRAVSAYLRTIPFELGAWFDVQADGLEVAKARGQSILAYVDALVRSHVERAAPATIGGHTVPVVNATAVVSEVGNELAASAPFAAVWSVAADGSYLYSLRSCASNPDHVDVSEIARRYGGGGHRHAAGFRSRHLAHELPG